MTDSPKALPAAPANSTANPKMWPVYVCLAGLLILVILAAAFFWFYQSQHDLVLKQTIHQQSQRQQVLEQSLESYRSELQEQQRLLKRTQNELSQLEEQAVFNNQQLNALSASSRSDWLLAEAEYLMRLANQRLGIEGDVRGAEAILQAADKVLSDIEDPGLLSVRMKLAEEILALQQTASLDRTGLYARIEALIDQLDTLPIESYLAEADSAAEAEQTSQAPEATTGTESWKQLFIDMWSDLKTVFVIRRLDHPVEPLLAPEQSHYLKHNLRLMLEQAGFAALEQEQSRFERSLDKSLRWINNYFVGDHAAIQTMIAAIEELKSHAVRQALPDISGSLRLLKKRVEAMYRQHLIPQAEEPSPQSQSSSEATTS